MSPSVSLLALLLVPSADVEPKVAIFDPGRSARVRKFDFTYEATVTGLKPGKVVRIWVPVPKRSPDQSVKVLSTKGPGSKTLSSVKPLGNRILFYEGKADAEGRATVKAVYRIERREVLGVKVEAVRPDPVLLHRFSKADSKVPIAGKPIELLDGKTLPTDKLAAARALYDIVLGHMRYSKEGVGWGNGDSVWACANGYGNCTDFHSLFMSLARSRKIPAKFEIGFPLPEKRGKGTVKGYHCWAKFFVPTKGWIGVDISEADKNPKMADYFFGNLTENRVAFSVGRDVTLIPKQKAKPLNFFIYPHVEVDGKVHPQEKIERKFSFEDR